MITVYGRADSTNVQKVLWLFDELGIAFERIDKGGVFGGLDDAHYRALNPNGRIPTVVDGNVVMWESNAIMRHYTRQHAAHLFPSAPLEALRADMMIDWNTNQYWPALRPAYFGHRVDGLPMEDPAVQASLAATHKPLATLEAFMDGRSYVAGDAFSIGDIPVAISTNRWVGLGQSLADYPALDAWHRTVSARPAYAARVFSR